MDKQLSKEIRKNSNINSFIVIIFYILLILVSLFGDNIAALFIDPSSKNFDSVSMLIHYIILYVIGIPVILCIFRILKKKDDFKILGGFRKPEKSAGWIAKWIIITIGLTYAMSYATTIISTVIQLLTGVELHPIEITSENNALDKTINFFVVVILAPIFEELLFRETIYRNCAKYGAWSMIIITGLTFGLWHGNYAQTLYTATLGAVACLLVAKTRSVFPAMLLHFCLNLIGGLQLIFINFDDLDKMKNMTTISDMLELMDTFIAVLVFDVVIWGLMIAGIVLFIIELVKHRDSFKVENRIPEVLGARKTLTYLTAPVTIIMFVLLTGITVLNAVSA